MKKARLSKAWFEENLCAIQTPEEVVPELATKFGDTPEETLRGAAFTEVKDMLHEVTDAKKREQVALHVVVGIRNAFPPPATRLYNIAYHRFVAAPPRISHKTPSIGSVDYLTYWVRGLALWL